METVINQPAPEVEECSKLMQERSNAKGNGNGKEKGKGSAQASANRSDEGGSTKKPLWALVDELTSSGHTPAGSSSLPLRAGISQVERMAKVPGRSNDCEQ